MKRLAAFGGCLGAGMALARNAARGTWFALLGPGLALLVADGCAGSSVRRRQAERPAAYAALPQDLRTLVDRGELAKGMDTNAVFLAWGRPDEVETVHNVPDGPELWWRYFRDRIENRPSYVYLSRPGRNGGINVYTIYHTTSWKCLWREVTFRREQVDWWHTFEVPP